MQKRREKGQRDKNTKGTVQDFSGLDRGKLF